jgi:hypothetical protein
MASQWDKLQEMRERRTDGGPVPEKAAGEVKLEPEVQAAADVPPVETPAETPAAVKPAGEAAPVVAKPDDATSQAVEIEFDGQKMLIDPSLAAVLADADKTQKANAPNAERAAIVQDVLAAVEDRLPKPKTAAELAADAALAEAEAESRLLKKPDAQLLISDLDEYERQRDLYEEQRVQRATDKTKREIAADTQRQNAANAAATDAQNRAILREQFYLMYPALKDSASVVDPVLDAQFTDVVKSGRAAAVKTAAEGEALKFAEFKMAAAEGAKAVLRVVRAARTVAPPPTPPPTLAASAPVKGPAAPKVEAPKPAKEKYPKGSVSSLLAERRAKREGAAA